MVAGIVTNHAVTMSFAVDHRMAEKRFDEPTPMIAEEMTCVVLTGAPIAVMIWMTAAAEVSAAKPESY